MKRYLTPIIEGYTIGSKNIIHTARNNGVKSTIFSAEPWNGQTQDPSTYVLHSLFAERYLFSDVISAIFLSFYSNVHDFDIFHFLPNLAGDVYASFINPKIKEKIKIIAHFSHPYHPYIQSPLSNFRLTYLFNKVLDYVFCINQFLVSYFQEKTGIEDSRIFCVPFPLDTERYKPSPKKENIRDRYGFSAENIITYVGQIEPVRGVFILLKAFNEVIKNIDDVQLVVSSPGIEYENLFKFQFKKIIKKRKLQDKVKLLPAQSKIEDLYNVSDVMVFPYIQPYHYMDPPLTLLEAMSCGSLVIASSVGAVNGLVFDEKNGKLVKPGDIKGLVESMIECIRNPDDYDHLKSRARESIKSTYSMERVGILLTDIYNKILE
jgi:glycosyltransferase involved in cell wall biosynthesis